MAAAIDPCLNCQHDDCLPSCPLNRKGKQDNRKRKRSYSSMTQQQKEHRLKYMQSYMRAYRKSKSSRVSEGFQ